MPKTVNYTKKAKLNLTEQESQEIEIFLKNNPNFDMSSLTRYALHIAEKLDAFKIKWENKYDLYRSAEVPAKGKLTRRWIITYTPQQYNYIDKMKGCTNESISGIIRGATLRYIRKTHDMLTPEMHISEW